ncbi:MAG: CoA ester lyase [Clostridiales bacterium]|nr:CoA ester lyase [Clostridiales bacterium]
MRRSLLFIPGNNPAMLQNCDVFESDAVILDLEDAVSVTEKDAARALVSGYLKSLTEVPPMEIIVRINGLDTEYYEHDLEAIVSDKIDTVMLPKATVEYLNVLDKLLSKAEKAKDMQKRISVIPIVELAVSVLQIEEIVKCPRVNGVLLGAEDLSGDLGVMRTKQGNEILYPRMRLAYACAAYKIDAIDTPFTDTNDNQGLKEDCRFVNNLGFNAKAAIHPNQVPVINEVFVPERKSIEWALRVEEAARQASLKGLGVFGLDGKMVDKPVITRAQNILEKARKYKLI